MHYLAHTDQPEMTSDSVFIPEDKSQRKELEKSPASSASPEPKRTTGSTTGQPPGTCGTMLSFGVTIHDAQKQPWYKQTILIPCE